MMERDKRLGGDLRAALTPPGAQAFLKSEERR